MHFTAGFKYRILAGRAVAERAVAGRAVTRRAVAGREIAESNFARLFSLRPVGIS